MYLLRLFGRSHIEGPDGPLAGRITQRRRIGLLAVLALSPGRAASRDKLVALFWPESDTERARHNLTDGVYVIRKELSEGAIRSVGDDLVLDERVLGCDVIAFEAALAAGEPERAVSLYAGPLLDGVHISDAPEFERWLDAERARLHGACARAWETLATDAEERGDTAQAVAAWQRLAGMEPTSGRVALGVVRALAASGDRPAAIRHAEAHSALVREEFGAEPDAELLAWVDALRNSESAAGRPLGLPQNSGRMAAESPQASKGADAGAVLGQPVARAAAGGVSRPVAPFRKRGRRGLVFGAVLTAVTGFALVAAIASPRAAPPELQSRRLLVLPFENRTPHSSLDALGSAAAERVTFEILRRGIGQVVSESGALAATSRVTATRREPRALARAAGAATLIYGGFHVRGDSLEFHALVQDVEAGVIVHAMEPLRVSRSDPHSALGDLSSRLLGIVAAHFDETSVWKSYLGLVFPPPDYAAYWPYQIGSERFAARDFEGAIEPLTEAIQIDSTFASALLLLSATYVNLERRSVADSLVRLAEPLRDRMTRYELRIAQSMRAFLDGDVPGQLAATADVPQWAPGSGLHYQAGLDALQNNRPRQALASNLALDPTSGWIAAGWHRYWFVRTKAHHALGNHEAEIDAARQAVGQFPQQPATLEYLAVALAAAGELDELGSVLDLASSTPGDPIAARTMWTAGRELRAHGYREAAQPVLERAVALRRALTTGPDLPLAVMLYSAGDFDEARAMFEILAESDPEHPQTQAYLGFLAARRGDRGRAEAIATWLSDQGGGHPLWRARIAALLGERERAVELMRELAAAGFRGWHELHRLVDLEALRGYAPYEEFVRPKE